MIELIQFPPAFGLSSLSPFCMKVDTYLRLTKIPYSVTNRVHNFGVAYGKLPAIRDADVVIADSRFILEHLSAKNRGGLDQGLTASEKHQHHLVQVMFEENLYFANYFFRVAWDPGWKVMEPLFSSFLPFGLGRFIPSELLVRRRGLAQINAQGIGHLKPDEVMAEVSRDVIALAHILADRPYFGGDNPRSVDCTAYAFLAGIIMTPIASPLQQAVAAQSNLMDYHRRMKELLG